MLECAIHPITYRGEGILATVVKELCTSCSYILIKNLSLRGKFHSAFTSGKQSTAKHIFEIMYGSGHCWLACL